MHHVSRKHTWIWSFFSLPPIWITFLSLLEHSSGREMKTSWAQLQTHSSVNSHCERERFICASGILLSLSGSADCREAQDKRGNSCLSACPTHNNPATWIGDWRCASLLWSTMPWVNKKKCPTKNAITMHKNGSNFVSDSVHNYAGKAYLCCTGFFESYGKKCYFVALTFSSPPSVVQMSYINYDIY
jgi:hypothetical protein